MILETHGSRTGLSLGKTGGLQRKRPCHNGGRTERVPWSKSKVIEPAFRALAAMGLRIQVKSNHTTLVRAR